MFYTQSIFSTRSANHGFLHNLSKLLHTNSNPSTNYNPSSFTLQSELLFYFPNQLQISRLFKCAEIFFDYSSMSEEQLGFNWKYLFKWVINYRPHNSVKPTNDC